MRTWLSRLAEILAGRSRDERLSREIEHHLEMLAEDHRARGLSDADARLAARREFGGVDRMRILHREQRGLPVVDSLLQDVRFAVRVLKRDWGFTLTAAIVLGAGIGVNNMFFTLVYAHKFRGLDIPRPDRVLFVSTFDDRTPDRALTPIEFEALRKDTTAFQSLGAYVNGVATIGDSGRAPDRFDAAFISSAALATVGLQPLMGRGPDAVEDWPGAAPVVMLGADAWQQRYGRDPGILGRTVLVNGTPATVIGILSARSGFPSTASIWLPLGQLPGRAVDGGPRSLRVIGRLRDEVSEVDARSEVEAIFTRLESEHPDTNRSLRARVVPLNRRLLGNLDGWMAFITAGTIVILVACANVANLMIARAMHRTPEMALRTSLGASRFRLIRQLLVEGMGIAVLGGGLGLLFSVGGVRLFQSAIPANMLPYWFDYSMDPFIVAALVTISVISVFVFGLVPAAQASRADANLALKDGSRVAHSGRATRVWTAAFLTAELALAMVMLAQFARGNVTTRLEPPTDSALRTTVVLTAAVTLPADTYQQVERRTAFFRALDEKLHARAEVHAAAIASFVPAAGASTRRLDIEGVPSGAAATTLGVIDIGPRYFDVLDLPVVAGRAFTDTDDAMRPSVAIVNERFVELFFGGGDALGRRIAVTPVNAPPDANPEWLSIVGVARAIRHQPGLQLGPVVYLPAMAAPPMTATLLMRSDLAASPATALLREQVLALDPNVPLYRMQTLGAAFDDATWNTRVSNYLALTVTILCLMLAAVGLFGVTAHSVTLRTREIGIRIALGAGFIRVAGLVLRTVRVPLVLGLLFGALGAIAWDRAFSSGLIDEYAAHPGALSIIGAILTAIVVVACLVPVRRATTVDPVSALRHE